MSRLIQPRGLKYIVDHSSSESNSVEAYTASWIEIQLNIHHENTLLSRLIQPRGLKFRTENPNHIVIMSRLIQPRGLK